MNKIMMSVITAFIVVCQYTSAQEVKVKKVFDEMRLPVTKINNEVDESILFKPNNEPFVRKYAELLLSDTTMDKRMVGVSLIARVAYKSSDSVFRQWVAVRLISFFRDSEPAVANRAAKYLTGFRRSDFSPAALDSFRSLIGVKTCHYDLLLKLAGFVGICDKAPEIKSELITSTKPSLIKWASILALARMGEKEYVLLCLFTIKDSPVNDNLMFCTLPELIYTRQRQIFDYLIELVQSDNANCHSPNPNYSGNILCAYRVMEALAGVIDNFPVKIRSSGDLITDSYEKSLQITRKWLIEHKNDYQINTEKY